ncbi:MAG: iron chaperone [Micrococcales bacterium]
MAEQVFTKEEKAAMRAAAAERRKKFSPEEHTADVVAKIKSMVPADRKLAEKVHKLVMSIAPQLQPKLWYGMQAYSLDGKNLLFFQDGEKFKSRYCTLGFTDTAKLDKGGMWGTSFAVTEWSDEVEKQISTLVKKAIK